MKHIKYIAPLIVLVCVNVAQAGNMKTVEIPFYNEPIATSEHSGLSFSYDMSGTPTKKLVCEMSHLYKAWMEFSDAGMKETGTYGNSQSVIFTSTGKNEMPNNDTAQFHADASGNLKINAYLNNIASAPTASCYYLVETTSVK